MIKTAKSDVEEHDNSFKKRVDNSFNYIIKLFSNTVQRYSGVRMPLVCRKVLLKKKMDNNWILRLQTSRLKVCKERFRLIS